jgi:UDP-sugar transporter A1/2/3
MILLLGRTLGVRRWLSLIVLTVGVSIVSLPSSNAKDMTLDIHDFSDHFFPRSMHELGQFAGGAAEAAAELTKRGLDGLMDELTKRSATYEGIAEDLDGGPKMNYAVGLTAVLVAAVVSGLTGVYFEKLLKNSATPASVWTRNIQLSFYSLFPALIFGVIINDGEEIAKHGFFDGYNSVVWTAIVLQAIGGILASLCINYADNIAKNFATSISIVISFLFSVVFFNFHVTLSVRLYPLLQPCSSFLLTHLACTYSSSSAQPSSSSRHTCTPSPSASAPAPRPSPSPATRRRPSSRAAAPRPAIPLSKTGLRWWGAGTTRSYSILPPLPPPPPSRLVLVARRRWLRAGPRRL